MTRQRLPVISVKGKPFDCGQQYGSQAREQIRRNVEIYFNMWGTLWGAKRPEILKQCRGLVPAIGEYDADILEELEGVAKGADLSLEEIITLNARYEINVALGIVPQGASDGQVMEEQKRKRGRCHSSLFRNSSWVNTSPM